MSKQKKNEQLDKIQRLPPGVKLLRTLEGHENIVYSIGFDPTGRTLASVSQDSTLKLWDVTSGKLLHTLEGHENTVHSMAFDPTGRTLASAGQDNMLKLWDVSSGKLFHTLKGHENTVHNLAFDPTGRTLASGGQDSTLKLWDVASRKLLHTLEGHENTVHSIAFDPTGRTVASAGQDNTLKLWDVSTGKLLRVFKGHENVILSVAFGPTGRTLVSGSKDQTIRLWEITNGKLLRILEGHISGVDAIAFSMDGRLFVSKSGDGSIRLWNCETWATVAVIWEPTLTTWNPGPAFHPSLPLLASVGSKPDTQENERCKLIHFWELDLSVLLGKMPEPVEMRSVHHTTAKIVLVGDSGVGKTALGWRLAHGEFKEHASTHGQQFWVINELGMHRKDGTECEAILWDLAGQPDYPLIHSLFLNDSDLALIVFDPTASRDPLHGVEFWLKQLKAAQASPQSPNACQAILVGARSDRGEASLTQAELDEFCHQHGILGGYLATSAKDGQGLDDLLGRMKALIPWDQKSAAVTTLTFKRIKDYVLKLKESRRLKVIVSPSELRKQLEKTDRVWQFSSAEMMTAVGHLTNYGYVHVLRTSQGEERILLAPELLNNLAASFVLEARRNPRGLGSLEEKRLQAGEYHFRELEKLSAEDRDVLLDAAVQLFLEHNICFREPAPSNNHSYLVFPELINLKKPTLDNEQPTEDDVVYTVSGAVENVYASLVVRLSYTQTFTRTNQWQNQAQFETYEGGIFGFRQSKVRAGEIELALYYGLNVSSPQRRLFQGLFEGFLTSSNVTVTRYTPLMCPTCAYLQDRTVLIARLRDGKKYLFCPNCGVKITIPKATEPLQISQEDRSLVDQQQVAAKLRTRFETALVQVRRFLSEREGTNYRTECFISYAWGDSAQERWVERRLASDLNKAGINILLDRLENRAIGSSVSRFIDRIDESDFVLVVGTPLYRQKYENKLSKEIDLISKRLLDLEERKQTVLPLLLNGEAQTAFPPLLSGRVYADFRREETYFVTLFDLILTIYRIPLHHSAVADLREDLQIAVPGMMRSATGPTITQPLQIAREFFSQAGFGQIEVLSSSLLRLNHTKRKEIALAALWDDGLEQSHLRAVAEEQRPKESGRLRIYLIYEESRLSTKQRNNTEQIHQLRRELDSEVIPLWSESLNQALSSGDYEEMLRTLEEPYLIRTDPYFESKPIDDQMWFFGRTEMLNRVPRLLAQGQHVGIFGLRKVGKTSLLKQLRQRFAKSPTVFIDCQAESELKAYSLLDRIVLNVQAEFDRLGVKQHTSVSGREFKDQLLVLSKLWASQQRNDPFIIILDEIDKLLPDQRATNQEAILTEYIRFFRQLRAAAQVNRSLVTLVVAYRPDVNRRNILTPAVGENPMFMSFKEEYLGFLAAEESETMIREIGGWKNITWDKFAARKVFDYCGGHPLVTRIFASEVCKQGSIKFIGLDRVEATAHEVIANFRRHDIGNYYSKGILELLREDERQVLTVLNGGVVYETDLPVGLEDGLTNLERFGLLTCDQGKLRLTAKLFEAWLQRRIVL